MMDDATQLAVLVGMIRHNLTPRQRDIVWLYIQGVPVGDIATRLGTTRNNCYQRLKVLWVRIGTLNGFGNTDDRSPVRMLRLLVGAPAVYRIEEAA